MTSSIIPTSPFVPIVRTSTSHVVNAETSSNVVMLMVTLMIRFSMILSYYTFVYVNSRFLCVCI